MEQNEGSCKSQIHTALRALLIQLESSYSSLMIHMKALEQKEETTPKRNRIKK